MIDWASLLRLSPYVLPLGVTSGANNWSSKEQPVVGL
jgi:hypothetical protein